MMVLKGWLWSVGFKELIMKGRLIYRNDCIGMIGMFMTGDRQKENLKGWLGWNHCELEELDEF